MMKKKTICIFTALLALVASVGLSTRPSNHHSIDERPRLSMSPEPTPTRFETREQLEEATAQISDRISLRDPEPISAERAAFLEKLKPRTPHPKVDPVLPHRGEDFRIVVKFKDGAKARPDSDGRLSVVAEELPSTLASIVDRHDIEFSSYFTGIEEKMVELEERAAKNSGNSQADFRGIASVKVEGSAPTLELATQLNNLDIVEYAYVEALDVRTPSPSDTPDFTEHQAWRLTDPGHGIDYAWASNAKGQGVRISVIEGAYRENHEDLVDANIINGLEEEFPEEANVPTDYSSNVDVVSELTGITPRDHGTSTLGVICAQENSFGMTGMAPEARVQFYSNDTINNTFSTAFNIGLAAQNSRAGDIILLEVQSDLNMGATNFGPAELELGVWDATKLAVDAGVVIVAAAGNGSVDLDSPVAAFYKNRGDSGAIIVGAGAANGTHNKMPFSSYGSRVNIHAWGEAVATTGDGAFNVGGDLDRGYKDGYGGTSSASALVAAACTSLQSLEMAAHNTTMSPIQMRSLLRNNGNFQGDSATNGSIGKAVDLKKVVDERYSANAKYVVDSVQWTERFDGTGLPNRLDGWRILSEPGGMVHNSGNSMKMDSNLLFGSTSRLSTATLHLRLAGKEGVTLDFDHVNFHDSYSGASIQSYTGTADADGVFMSADGFTWHRLNTVNFSALDTTARSFRLSLDLAAEAAGIEFNNDFRIRFQTFTGGRVGGILPRGRIFDNISVHIGESGVIEFGAASTELRLKEGQTRTLAIRRLDGTDGTVGVRLRTVGGSATQGDWVPVVSNVTLANGENFKFIAVKATDDNVSERTETFRIELYDPSLGARLGRFRTATVIIEDNDRVDQAGVVYHGVSTSGANLPAEVPGQTMIALPIVVPADGPTSTGGVRVRLNDLTHEFAPDLDIFLESPTGQRVMLMSDAINQNIGAPEDADLFHHDLDFAESSLILPEFGPVDSGTTFHPADYGSGVEQFDEPIGTFTGGSDLQAFEGRDPRGTWTLYIRDQFPGNGGQLLGGWELLLSSGSRATEIVSITTTTNINGIIAHIDFNTVAGVNYKLQASPDLANWYNTMTETVVGDGGVKSISYPGFGERGFFRIIEIE